MARFRVTNMVRQMSFNYRKNGERKQKIIKTAYETILTFR